MTVTTYIVKSGDNLYRIAQSVYGSPEPGWRNIAAANLIQNPITLVVGQMLTIPPPPTT